MGYYLQLVHSITHSIYTYTHVCVYIKFCTILDTLHLQSHLLINNISVQLIYLTHEINMHVQICEINGFSHKTSNRKRRCSRRLQAFELVCAYFHFPTGGTLKPNKSKEQNGLKLHFLSSLSNYNLLSQSSHPLPESEDFRVLDCDFTTMIPTNHNQRGLVISVKH